MLIDMILPDASKPELQTRYRDPAVLHALGYEAIVIPNALAALAGAAAPSNVDPLSVATSRRGLGAPEEVGAAIDAQISVALRLGMKVFLHVEPTLPPHLAEQHADMLCEDHTGRLCLTKDSACGILQQCIEAIVARWPTVAGIVVSAPPTASCTQCREVPILERLARLIVPLHATICEKLSKFYIHRLAPVAGTSIYPELAPRLPASDRLIISFPLPNCAIMSPTALVTLLRSDGRPKWLEFPSEGTVEGKGAFPNYQAPLWGKILAGLPVAPNDHARDAASYTLDICGISRGGGFGGPYPQREEWIDANVHALARLYQQRRDPAALDPTYIFDLATQWAGATFGIAESSPPAPAVAELLLVSGATIRKLLYVSALRDDPDAPPMPFLQNDLLDVESIWLATGRLVAAGPAVADQAITEKEEALAGVDRMRQDWEIAAQDLPNKVQARDLANTLAYLGSFASTVVNLLAGFTRFHQWAQGGRSDNELGQRAQRHLEVAETNWQQHVHHHATLPGAPSVLHDNTLWERTNACLAAIENQK
jgi:hypothetical protein